MQPQRNTVEQQDIARVLLTLIERLLEELRRSGRRGQTLNLDSSLDTDIGLDSLARVELIARIEQEFHVMLPQTVFTSAESPRDLVQAILRAQGQREILPAPQIITTPSEQIDALPESASTLVEMLQWHVAHHPQHLHIRLLDAEGDQSTLTYAELWQGASRVAAGLQQSGVLPGETISIMLPTSLDYFFSFYGILLAGAIPVPIYPPVRRSQLAEHLQRHSGILNNCVTSLLITVPEAKVVAQLLKSRVPSLRHIVTPEELSGGTDKFQVSAIAARDIAFLQYTSGSTGNPKGVSLTHANLLSNIRVMGQTVQASSKDVFVSWLPLYHDMGLIGAWLGSLYFAVQLVVMSPLSFLTRPQRWLQAIHQYRGTLSAAPNFGYELCLKRISDADLKGLDLSCWRLAFNGAEPVSPDTLQRFTQRFAVAGFRSEVMMPVYGLAENSVGLAFPALHSPPRIDCVQRDLFSQTGQATAAAADDGNALCFVGSGQPLAEHEIRIVDTNSRELPERREGYLQFRGPSATAGYYRNPEATRKLFDGDWLDSGDLAYIAEGDVFITGRSKDLIIRGGRNVYPHELEEVVGNLKGIRKGCVAVFGSSDPHTRTEQMVVLAETRDMDPAVLQQLEQQVIQAANDLLGMPPDVVLLVPPHTVLKTSSGKIRRAACRQLYERGQLARSGQAMWRQIAVTLFHALLPEWRRLWQRTRTSLYAAYAWMIFTLLAGLTWSLIVLTPGFRLRWRVLRRMSQSLARLTFTPVRVHGLSNLPAPGRSCIYVCNHASYLDSLFLVGAIPRAFRFIAKSELRNHFITRLFLQRIQAEFVERFDKQQGALDAQRIAQLAGQQQSLFFFPEGTFTRMPGLREFYMGAFVTAVEAGVPVVPIALHGTRSMLRGESRFPHQGRITLHIGAALDPAKLGRDQPDKWHVALALREAARRHILQYCGEPDLVSPGK